MKSPLMYVWVLFPVGRLSERSKFECALQTRNAH